MVKRRIESFLMLATLLIVSIFMLSWLQGQPFATASAQGQAAPAAMSAAAVPAAVVAIPRTFSYQGTLRDANGNLINGAVNLTLNLYAAITGGSALHTESFPGVNVRNGLFSVVVGDATPIAPTVFDNFPLYLGLRVNQDAEMLPRQRLHPVPYAMQASSAQTAGTASNLVAGGGVPNLVTLGAAGASEIGFAPNGGKITNDANGLILTGGANSRVATTGALAVGGDLTVAGSWNAGAIRDRGDSNGGANQRSTYPVSINRYVVEAPDNGASPDTAPVDDVLLTQLCQDEDGCRVSLYMRDWDPANAPGLLAGVGPYRMALAAAANGKRQWSVHNTDAIGVLGIDNNAIIENILNVQNACLFNDGAYVNAQGSDGALGFGLLNWAGAFDSVSMTCVLIIED